jgi:superfamily I DNA/RNA helicase
MTLLAQAREKFAQGSLKEGLLWFLTSVDYQRAIAEEAKTDKMRAFKWENVLECVNAHSQFEQDRPKEEATLQRFVSETTLGKPQFSHTKSEQDKIQLMTMHSAKGLEFPICFIAALEEKILPHERSLAETGLEEERRLFYVAVTRARRKLILSMARSRMRMGKETPTTPSRFLLEIPKHLLRLTHAKDLPSYSDLAPQA